MKRGCAVVRTGDEPISLEQLERAFARLPGLTAADAGLLCQNALGILVKNFEKSQATALQLALKSEGVETEVVEETLLPVLPAAKAIQRLVGTPAELTVSDSIGVQTKVAWGNVRLIAAGRVRQAIFPRTRREWEEVHVDHIHIHHVIMIPITVRETKFEYTSRESSEWSLRAEILLARGAGRFSVEADRFDFGGLGEQASKRGADPFRLLVRRLAEWAPHAALNRGASSLLAEPPEIVEYPGKQVLEDEMTWMLWWAARQQS